MREANLQTGKDFWKALIKEQERSGLSQAEFCTTKGLSRASFYNWRSVLKKEKQKDLVRVEVLDGKPEPMRIVFAGGVVLHFSQTPAPEWIMELMRLVS